GADRTVLVWEVATGHIVHTLKGHTGEIWSVAWSPNGKLLASGSDDKTVKVWDADKGEAVRTIEGHERWVRGVAFDPDSQLVAARDANGVRVWKVEAGVEILS